jgi:hypothetical protein
MGVHFSKIKYLTRKNKAQFLNKTWHIIRTLPGFGHALGQERYGTIK